MIDRSPPELQVPSDRDISVDQVFMIRKKAAVVKSLDVEQQYAKYAKDDKQALERFLKLGIVDALAQGQSLNLGTNEELPRLIPVLFAHFSREELLRLIGEGLTAKLVEIQHMEVLQNLFLEGELQKVLHAFNEAHIPLMLFKGPALAYSVYPQAHIPSHIRTYHDIDGLIQPTDLDRAHKLLTEIGYTFYEEFRANVINNKRTGYNYILKEKDSWLEVLIELHTAPHDSEIGTVFDIDDMWANAQAITVLGEPTLTMHPTDHMLYLCWHYRFHAFSRLLWLYDIVVFARTFTDEDWAIIVRKAVRQRLATTLYYCLVWCRDLFGVAIPAMVFVQLHPPFCCQYIVERIAMPNVAKVLATVDGQSRRVLAHRAMVDTTAGLLKAGLRTLFPTPAAMGQRYMEHSRMPLQFFYVFYLIHPWITLAKGLQYLLMPGRHKGPGAKL